MKTVIDLLSILHPLNFENAKHISVQMPEFAECQQKSCRLFEQWQQQQRFPTAGR